MNYLIVFLGAGIGGTLRQLINVAAAQLGGSAPIGTLAINVVGSFAMGAITEYFALHDGRLPQAWRLFLTTGILGGFTTFSAFSLEAVLLYEQGDRVAAAGYVAGSVVFSIGALFAALALIRTLMRK
jgi:fluoride exporter